MPTFPIDSFFDSDFAQPATYVDKNGISKEIFVIPDISEMDSSIRESKIHNRHIELLAKTEDVPSIAVDETIYLNDVLANEEGEDMMNNDGNLLVAERQMTCKVISASADNYGFTTIIASID